MKEAEAFTCRMCGHCCEGAGGIVLADKDAVRLAAHLGLSVASMLAQFGEERGGKRFVASREGRCVFFLDGQGCSVHPAKPDVCRAWPFFRGNLVDESSWRMAGDYCPGINLVAGFAEFVREGRAYLQTQGLARSPGEPGTPDMDDAPVALVLPVDLPEG